LNDISWTARLYDTVCIVCQLVLVVCDVLQATLLSRRPALRKAAAATLRHLAERDPYLLLPARVEGALFAALDGESNAAIASEYAAVLPSGWCPSQLHSCTRQASLPLVGNTWSSAGTLCTCHAGQLRATLSTLLEAGAPDLPSYWLACLSEVVFSTAGVFSQGLDHDSCLLGSRSVHVSWLASIPL
jgi:hypothetical protein